jgi:restriction system protein
MADFKTAYEDWARNHVFLAGRAHEMATLQGWLLVERQPIVGVVGPASIGKTTLAYQFMQEHAEQFPGGTRYLRGLSDKLPQSPEARSLVVLDDMEAATSSTVDDLLAHAHASKRQFIVVSREPLPGVHSFLKLTTLGRRDVIDIFHSLLLDVPPEDEDLLATLAGGYPHLAQLLAVVVRDNGLAEGLKRLVDFSRSGIVDAAGNPIRSDSPTGTGVTAGLVIASDEVIRRLAAEPELMHRLSAREFEDLVAELLSRQGYEVELTPVSKDGGKDIYVAHKSGLGSALYVVECKRYAPENPVGVGIVRQLYGVVQAEQLTGGVVATTSYFTRGAKQFQESVRYQMFLSDYQQVRAWLSSTHQGLKGTA